MKGYRRIVLALGLILSSCAHRGETEEGIVANLDDTCTIPLSKIGNDIHLLPLYSEKPIGNILSVRKYGDSVFLLDDVQRQIVCVDENGNANIFNRLGRGAGEYVDISCFSFIEESDELVVFDRHAKSLKFFTLPDGKQTRSVALDFYINGMEMAGKDKLLAVRSGNKNAGTKSSLVLLDVNSGEAEDLIPLQELQGELMEDISFNKEGDTVFFGITGPKFEFYKYSADDLEKVGSVFFRPDVLSKGFWEGEDYDKQADILLELLEKGEKEMAIAPFWAMADAECLCFWYMTGRTRYNHNLPDRDFCIIRDGKAEIYSTISCPELGIDRLQPLGTDGKSYISLITAEETVPQPGTELGDAFLAMQAEGVDTALLIYDLL